MSSDEKVPEPSADAPWTLGRLLAWTTQFLRQRGSDSPQLDAQLLLAHARQCSRIELFTAYDQEASASLRDEFRELVRRRAAGTPVAYLVGHREFYSLDFRVTPEVLIPRPETEFLVIAALDYVKQKWGVEAALKVADVGTGSGILAICLARQLLHTRVWGTDISETALAVARVNCESHQVLDRVELVCGDLFSAVPENVWLDLVVSNPPYVTESEFAELPRDVREYEPRHALVAGEQGTEVIERLIAQAAEKLKPGGCLFLEISPMIERSVQDLIAQDGRYGAPETVRDLAGHARVIQAAIPL